MAVELDPLAGIKGGDESKRLAAFWKQQITKVDDDSRHKRWKKRASTIEKRYRDERNRTDEDGQRRCNILWTNIEILTPAIYAKCPIPIVERRFKDKDPIGRGAAQILERGLRNEIEIAGFDEALYQAVRDYLLVGRGVVWVRYEPEFEESTSIVQEGGLDLKDNRGAIAGNPQEGGDETVPEEMGDEEVADEEQNPELTKLRQTGFRVSRESTPVDYVHWSDYYTIPFNARVWKEVTAVARRVFMTRNQMKRRFGASIGAAIPLRKDERGAQRYDGADQAADDKGEVFEIWSLADKQVFWTAEGYDYLCDRKDDPLQLENFFPCPRPIYSNTTTGTLIPVPDYIEYQDQAIQIDELTQRISMLAKACKVAGVYNAAAKDIMRLLDESVENELIPVDDWAAFAEKGGVAGNISLLPLKEIIGCINELQGIKEKTVIELDRLTGITDIMRGTTDARETFGGQRLKTNTSGTRIQRRQNEVARFARDTVRIMGDIMSEHFSPISLVQVSGALYEEGLGDVDMPSLTEFQNPMAQLPMPPPQPQFSGPQQAQGPAPLPAGAGPPALNGQIIPPGVQMGGSPNMLGPMAPSGMPGMPQPQIPPELMAKFAAMQRISKSIALLRDEKSRGFRIDIEVDSTLYGDSEQEKKDRTQFITVVTQYLQQSLMMGAQVPEMTPLLAKFLQFGVRGFHVGRDLETAIEEFADQATKLAKQKQSEAKQQPNPQLISAQANMLKAQTTAASTKAKDQRENVKVMADVQKTKQDAANEQAQSQAEIQRQAVETAGEQHTAQADLAMKQMEVKMKEMDVHIAQMREMFEMMRMQRMQTQTINKAMEEPVV